jgi:hypothetical protein
LFSVSFPYDGGKPKPGLFCLSSLGPFRTGESSFILSLHLKQSRKLRPPILVGSVHIKIGELLDRCMNDQSEVTASEPGPSSAPNKHSCGTTLSLLDAHGQETGSLVVKLLALTSRTDNTIDKRNLGRGDGVSPPSPEPIQNAIEGSGAVIISLLGQVVDKTRLAGADSVGKTAEVCVLCRDSARRIFRDHTHDPE